MTVQKYYQPEVTNLIHDENELEAWNNLVSNLGLSGQEKVVHEDKSPVPFQLIKTSVKNILETLCPISVEISNYSKTPIPVEVLELISLAQREKYFSKIEIWYDNKDPDPVVIGHRKEVHAMKKGKYSIAKGSPKSYDREVIENWISENETSRTKYKIYDWGTADLFLLARWGDESREMPELRELAVKRFLAEKGVEYRKQIKEAQRGLDDLEDTALTMFGV